MQFVVALFPPSHDSICSLSTHNKRNFLPLNSANFPTSLIRFEQQNAITYRHNRSITFMKLYQDNAILERLVLYSPRKLVKTALCGTKMEPHILQESQFSRKRNRNDTNPSVMSLWNCNVFAENLILSLHEIKIRFTVLGKNDHKIDRISRSPCKMIRCNWFSVLFACTLVW